MIEVEGIIIKLWNWYAFIPSINDILKLAKLRNKTVRIVIKED